MASLNCRTTSAVRSVDPSSTTMISLRGQVCPIADSSVWPIVFSALYALITIETSGFMSQRSAIRGQRSEVRGQKSENRRSEYTAVVNAATVLHEYRSFAYSLI